MANQEVNNDMEQARQLREAKMAQSTNNTEQNKSSQEDTKEKESRAGLLRRKVRAVKRAEKIQRKKEKKMKGKAMLPAKLVTNRLLRQAWYFLILSWGLTVFYIDLHVFLWFVLGEEMFCKLGDEWLPRQIRILSGKAGSMTGRAIGIIEVIVLIIVNVIVAIFLWIVISIIIFIADNMILKIIDTAVEIIDVVQ